MRRKKAGWCPCGAKLADTNREEAYYVASCDFWSWETLLARISEEAHKPAGPDRERLAELVQALDNWLRIRSHRTICQCPHCGRLSVTNMDPNAVFDPEHRVFQSAPEDKQPVFDLFKPVDPEDILSISVFRGVVNADGYQSPIDAAEEAADALVYSSYGAGGPDSKSRLKDVLAAVQKCGDGWHSLEAIRGDLAYVIHNDDLVRRLDAWVEQGKLEKRDFLMFARTEYRLTPE